MKKLISKIKCLIAKYWLRTDSVVQQSLDSDEFEYEDGRDSVFKHDFGVLDSISQGLLIMKDNRKVNL